MRTKYKSTFIYGLIDPITNGLRYVGKSNKPEDRHYQHQYECYSVGNCTTHKNNWLRGLKRKGLVPIIIILEEVPEYCWQLAEIWWISYMKSLGCDLTNSSIGGDGITMTQNVRQKISRSRKGIVFSESHIQNLSIAQRNREFSYKPILAMQLHNTGKHLSDETKLKISIALTGYKHTENTRLNMSLTHLGEKNNRYGTKHTEETKSKMRNSALGRVMSEESRRKMSEAKRGRSLSEETKRKMSLTIFQNKRKKLVSEN